MGFKNLIIGSNGYIGRFLLKELRDLDQEVICISSGEDSGISLDTGLFSSDFSLPSDIDTVYYLAQSPRYRDMPQQSPHLLSVNCISAVQAAEAARKAGVRRFIYASTGNVYEHSFLPLSEKAPVNRRDWYALSKVMAEDALDLYRPYIDITTARIFGVYGPYQTNKLVPMLAERLLKKEDILLDRNLSDPDDLDGLVVSLIYIDDLVKCLVQLKDIKDCNTINIAGTEGVSVRRLSTALALHLGLTPRFVVRDVYRHFNLISDGCIQSERLNVPLVSLSEGISRLVY